MGERNDDALTRVFAAPRELVFEVWTQAEHFGRWFAPDGAEILDVELDARPGGVLRFGHRFPGQATVHVKGSFTEVVPNRRLAFTSSFVDEHGRPAPHPMFADWPDDVVLEYIVTLEDEGGGTRVTIEQKVHPASVADHPTVKRHGELALLGWGQTLARLEAHLEAQAP